MSKTTYTTRIGMPVMTLINSDRVQWDVEPEVFASDVRKGRVRVVVGENGEKITVKELLAEVRGRATQTIAPALLRKAFLGIARF